MEKLSPFTCEECMTGQLTESFSFYYNNDQCNGNISSFPFAVIEAWKQEFALLKLNAHIKIFPFGARKNIQLSTIAYNCNLTVIKPCGEWILLCPFLMKSLKLQF